MHYFDFAFCVFCYSPEKLEKFPTKDSSSYVPLNYSFSDEKDFDDVEKLSVSIYINLFFHRFQNDIALYTLT